MRRLRKPINKNSRENGGEIVIPHAEIKNIGSAPSSNPKARTVLTKTVAALASTATTMTTTVAASTSNGPNMENGVLSQDVFKHFDKAGKIEFLKYIKQQVKDSNSPVYDKVGEFNEGISSVIYDLMCHGIRGTIRKDTVLNTLKEVALIHEELPSVILDIVNILDSETQVVSEDDRVPFLELLKDLDRAIPISLIKERLEIETLQDAGIVKQKVFYTKFIKIKTKLYYKQRRFNLFREESEGYAKLITELNQEFEDDVTSATIMDIIKSLIGCFNLDPNRVLDIILESFETRPERSEIFIPLLRAYMPNGTIICEVLGCKFRHFAETKPPKSLFHITALLLKFGVIDLNHIYGWLTPTDKAIIDDWEEELAEAHEFLRRLNVISTNKEKEISESVTEKEYDEEKYYLNQKLGLCEALLKIFDWNNAFKIMQKLPEQCVVIHENIARQAAELIHYSIDLVYTELCFKSKPYKLKYLDPANVLDQYQAKTFSELRQHAIPMITTLGPSIHYDTVLMYKLVRILRTILNDMGVDSMHFSPPSLSESEQLYYETMTILDAAILPALSYLDCNCPMAEEIWTVLKCFPYHYRYSLYARWKNDTYNLHPALIRRRGNAQKNVKALMKRVSKENVKPVGRLIGKFSHCCPGFLFDYILLQIQIYDNLIGPVVDSFKYLTALSFDCLGYCLVEALARADRDRFKHDGTSISMWLQSLASFCGAIFKKYTIELSGVLQYVANQLKSQKSLDLLILKEIVQKMAGVESAEEMTNEQLNAMCGGELLRGEAGYFSQVRNTKKSSQRLKEALANNDLAVAICLLMAQQKHCVVYRETAQGHLKLVGKLYDQCQDTLVQFGTFLGSTYTVDEYVERLPSIIVMLREYHIHADVAFFLARPMFTHLINQKYDQLRRADPNSKKLTTNQKLSKYLEAANYVMTPIIELVRPLHGPKVWEDISPQFFVTFWSLSMYDLQVPAESYQKEISKLKMLSLQAADFKDGNVSKNKKEIERYAALMEKLQDERKKQQEHVDKVLERLQQQKDTWFLSRSAKSAKNETITQFLQLCLFPRCTFTALDALYCAKFVHTIHNLKAANFSTLLCYDRIFCDITYTVTSCTENEATRYGRFLSAMLETVMRWHGDQPTFNRECENYPGFVTKFRVSNQFSESNDHVGYENYRHVCHKWHYKITKSIVFCLDSKEYMPIRNALIILMRILPYFPVLAKLSQIIERKVEKVRDEERNKRPDLFVIASSYIGQLKTKAAQMIKESDFHQVAERPSQKTDGLSNVQVTATTNDISSTTGGNTITNIGANNNHNGNLTTSNQQVSSTIITIEKSTSTLSNQSNTSSSSNITISATNLSSNQSQAKTTSNGDTKTDKRDRERSEKPKVRIERERERDRERDATTASISTIANNTVSTSPSYRYNPPIATIEIKDDISNSNLRNDHDFECLGINNGGRSLKTLKKEEKTKDRELREKEREQRESREKEREQRDKEREQRDKDREREQRMYEREEEINVSSTMRSRREKRREERQAPVVALQDILDRHNPYQSYDRERIRERDLSSVSNESNASTQQRKTQDFIEYEKTSKRRKMDPSTSSSKNHPDMVEMTKKERSIKTKERKEKLTDEEKDARKERKLGRKRDRLEETLGSNNEYKRRRDDFAIQNGDDDLRNEREIKYHSREKSPHNRDMSERSHDKFERERSGRNDDRQYGVTKSARSRLGY